MTWNRLSWFIGLALIWATTFAQSPTTAGAYTEAQAANGKKSYDQYCADCHHMSLKGTGHGPELAGPNFRAKWGARSTAKFISYNREFMPPEAPGSLSESMIVDIVAHIFRVNGGVAGDESLRTDSELLVGAAIGDEHWLAFQEEAGEDSVSEAKWENWQGVGTIAGAARKASDFINREVRDFSPVTGQMLRQPPAADWLNWRRTLDGQGYSPLDQVNRENVSNLKLVWALTMRDGSNQTTPLVHDGTMFLVNPENVVLAVNGATGDVIWEYAYTFPPASKTLAGPMRNIAIYQDKLFMATYDAAIVALDARSGKQLWRSVKADWSKGFTHTSGPIIAGGVVVSGLNGCERFKEEGCFVTGHDPDTGEELWRTSTIALPGDPNESTWGSVRPNLRAGGDTWIPGSYDSKLDLFYIGTAQAKPWVAASRGMSVLDAALYTNATLALNPRTGEIVWYFQHIPGETIDMEVGFERVLVDIDGQLLMVTIGKDGILWKLNRKTGAFIDFTETMSQTVFESLDKETGRVRYRKDIIDAKIGDPINVCPGIYGGHNWQATAYNPQSNSLIIPLHQLCVEMVGQEVQMVEGYGGYGGASRVYPMPGKKGMLGRLTSWDLRDMKELWSHEQRAMFLTSVLTTAGGLAFIGDLDRWFKAFDVDTGEVLWQVRLGSALHGFPITYAVDGKQYIAVPTGMGVMKLLTAKQSPEIYQPNGGNALYVFELPD